MGKWGNECWGGMKGRYHCGGHFYTTGRHCTGGCLDAGFVARRCVREIHEKKLVLCSLLLCCFSGLFFVVSL